MRSRQSRYRAALRLRLRLQQSNDERVVPRSASARGTTGGAVDRWLHPLRLFRRHVGCSVHSHTRTSGRNSPRSPVGAGVSRRLRGVRLSRGLPHDNAGRASFLPRDPRGLETMVALSGGRADSGGGDCHRTGGVKLRTLRPRDIAVGGRLLRYWVPTRLSRRSDSGHGPGREHHFQDSQGHSPLADSPRCRVRKPATTEAYRQSAG